MENFGTYKKLTSININDLESNLDCLLKQKNELLKESIVEMLERGVNIENETFYNSTKNILVKLGLEELPDYSSIEPTGIFALFKGITSFQIKKIGDRLYIYPGSLYLDSISSSAVGFIEKGTFIKKLSFTNFDDRSDNNLINSGLLQQECPNTQEIITLKQEKKVKEKEQQESIIENQEDFTYEVKKGDTLWKIIKEYYNLQNPRDIANCINKVIKLNNEQYPNLNIDTSPIGGDGILGDKIFVGQKIILPKEILFRKQIFQRI